MELSLCQIQERRARRAKKQEFWYSLPILKSLFSAESDNLDASPKTMFLGFILFACRNSFPMLRLVMK